jgi:hypothetical protein
MAVSRFGTHLDLQLNELRNTKFQTVTTLPASTAANAGWVVRYAADSRLYVSTGTGWQSTVAATGHVHLQVVPQAVVTVNHGLGYRPSVAMFSTDYGTHYAEFQTQHLDENTVRVSMDNPQACVLVMS